MNLIIQRAVQTVTKAEIEIVERKGLGHPDTIYDSMMEPISQALCREYLHRFGHVLHCNCDKGMLAAGRGEARSALLRQPELCARLAGVSSGAASTDAGVS